MSASVIIMEKDQKTDEIHEYKSNSYINDNAESSLSSKSVKFWRAHLVDQLNLPQSSKMVMYHLYSYINLFLKFYFFTSNSKKFTI